MDYKEEYQKALERAKNGLPIDEVFPELKESEDERIINQIISLIKEVQEDEDWHIGKWSDDAIAWLEKQKEQKPAEWSEEDEERIKSIKATLEQFAYSNGMLDVNGDYCDASIIKNMNWLKDLHTKVHMQPKQEWSEEDVEVLETTIATIEKNIKKGSQITTRATPSGYINREDLIKKLKSLRPQPHWKPSEEQMKAFHELLGKVPRAPELYELYNDLEKLMEE